MKLFGVILPGLIVLAGCGHDHSTHDDGDLCDDSQQTRSFELGSTLTSEDGRYFLTIDSSEPNPIGRGDNSWTVNLKDNAGNPVSDAKLVLEPTMPEHGHGTFPPLFLGAAGDVSGVFQLGPFDLIMPGTWLMNFTITGSDEATSLITVAYCVAN